LQELIAASWADRPVAKVIQAGLMGWFKLLVELARRAEREFGGLGPFKAEEVAALVGGAFIGAESQYLLGMEKKGVPIRQALRRFGDLIRMMEAVHRK
ncbi:MAG: TetR/AcrR family transcriptional regulator, partial [Terriglobia bacterium]